MRFTFKQAAAHPSRWGDWWLEWPARHRRYWTVLLFEKGQGWLRWGKEERGHWTWDEGPEPYTVAPPLRRFWWGLKYLFAQLFNRHGVRTEGGWEWPWTYSDFHARKVAGIMRKLVARLNAWMKRDAYRLGWNEALAVVRNRAGLLRNYDDTKAEEDSGA